MKGDNDNDHDNKAIIAKIAKLRVERSHLLGYESYADFVLERNMAKTPEKVSEFLSQVWDAATPVAKAEVVSSTGNDKQRRWKIQAGTMGLVVLYRKNQAGKI